MPPLEAWEKVWIGGTGAEAFFASSHGAIGCVDCHGGDESVSDKDRAHAGITARPSEGSDTICGNCHYEPAQMANSLHGGLWGEKNLVASRFGVDSFAQLPASMQQGYSRDCASCHTSCGDCHVSRPRPVGGGFIDGHRFGPPDLGNQCTACHGSRVGMEYRGENEGFRADVHFVPGGMRCQSCHSAEEMHGGSTRPDHRLDVENAPACRDCHEETSAANEYHQAHWGELQCQVCHSQDYKSCNRCHSGEGLAQPSYMSFKIGKNPVPDRRPEAYVLLRHIPIAGDTFSEWGAASLPNFAVAPTWKYTAPHNIQRWTDRTVASEGSSCASACHETTDEPTGFFLRQSDLDAMSVEEADANDELIVPNGSPVNW